MKQKQKRTIGNGWIAAGTIIVYLLAFMLLTTGCGGPSNEEMLRIQVNELTEKTNGQAATIEEQDKTIADLQGQIKDQDKIISNLEKERGEQEKALEELRARVEELEGENQQLSNQYEQATQLLQSISEIPERYKEVFVKTSELQFVATLFNQDIRAIKIDRNANKITDLRTDMELEMKGIHNRIEGSYGYEFTMEEFLNGDTSIAINGNYYSLVGMPTMLETKAMDGKVSLYDICQTLVVLRAEKNGQFVYSTQY